MLLRTKEVYDGGDVDDDIAFDDGSGDKVDDDNKFDDNNEEVEDDGPI